MSAADWLNLALRWVHLIAGIAWIGSSFYFIWLDNHLTAPVKSREGVEGELWMVHSGGFYQVERRRIGPGHVPGTLHWFQWEAAITWMSGVFLLVLVYYLTDGAFLLDPAVSTIGAGAATALSVGVIAGAWLLYDLLWRSPAAGRVASVISLVALGAVTYGLCRVLSGRAAYIHVGAMLGTLMVANVWMRILPAQRQMIAATEHGREPDFTLGERAKRRSVHNSYMTFPVLFIMVSTHYPGTYGHPENWLLLLLLVVAGAAARHLMIAKSGGGRWALAPGAAALAAVVLLAAPKSTGDATGPAGVRFSDARAVVHRHCVPCHSAYPSEPAFGAPAGGVSFDDPANIARLAARIRERAVVSQTMPLGNQTGMTQAERELLGAWIDAGARLR